MSEKNDRTVPVIRLRDLPVGTHIKDEEQGNYELTQFGMDGEGPRVWMEQYPHCMDCTTFVAEETDPTFNTGEGTWILDPASDYFRNWSVTLVPPLINADLLDQINKFNEAKIARPDNR